MRIVAIPRKCLDVWHSPGASRAAIIQVCGATAHLLQKQLSKRTCAATLSMRRHARTHCGCSVFRGPSVVEVDSWSMIRSKTLVGERGRLFPLTHEPGLRKPADSAQHGVIESMCIASGCIWDSHTAGAWHVGSGWLDQLPSLQCWIEPQPLSGLPAEALAGGR